MNLIIDLSYFKITNIQPLNVALTKDRLKTPNYFGLGTIFSPQRLFLLS